ncbi:MAG: hypothetical protein AAGH88_00040 [Planctomycetota bacterium]
MKFEELPEDEQKMLEAMWTTDIDKWIMWPSDDGIDDLIYRSDNSMLIIEDNELARYVTRRMRECGVEIRNTDKQNDTSAGLDKSS